MAFSIDSAADLKKVRAAFGGSLPRGSFEVHFQVVAGVVTDEEFGKILDAADGARVTLLGYKMTGRGKEAMKGLPVFDAPEQTGWVAEWAKRAAAAQVSDDAIQEWRGREADQYRQTHYNNKLMDAWWEKNPEPPYVSMPVVAIDTTLAALCREALAQHGVPKVLYSTSEGAFSAYIDAVDEALGPCSYAPDRMRPVDLDHLWSDFAEMQPLIQ